MLSPSELGQLGSAKQLRSILLFGSGSQHGCTLFLWAPLATESTGVQEHHYFSLY